MSLAGCALPEDVLEAWVARYGPELSAHVGRMVGDDDAQDVLQRVWITAHRKPPGEGGDGETHVRAWLYRVATNAALDRIARRRRRAALLAEKADRLTPEPTPAPDAVPDDGVRARVRAAVARLPRKQREAVWLRWADGLDYDAIGERLACSPESARANVYQGMKRLREDLAGLLNGEEP